MKSSTFDIAVNRRNFLRGAATAGVGAVAVTNAALAGSCSGPSKEKAVKVVGFIVELSREAVPLLGLLGAPQIAETLETKAIPALEKLKEALSKVDIPTATSTLTTVRNVLSGVATALTNLPESPRRTTIIGILASINVLLLTVEAFIDSEMDSVTVVTVAAMSAKRGRRASMTEKIDRAFEATKN